MVLDNLIQVKDDGAKYIINFFDAPCTSLGSIDDLSLDFAHIVKDPRGYVGVGEDAVYDVMDTGDFLKLGKDRCHFRAIEAVLEVNDDILYNLSIIHELEMIHDGGEGSDKLYSHRAGSVTGGKVFNGKDDSGSGLRHDV